MNENIKLFNGDCLEEMKNIPDKSIDLFITDCPYKITAGGCTIEETKDECSGILSKRVVSDGTRCSNKWIKKDGSTPCAVKDGKMFKHNDIKFRDWLPEVYRVLKEGSHCYIMINARNLKDLQVEAEKVGFDFHNIIIWDKGNATPNKWYMQAYEMILFLKKGKAKNINNMGTKNILNVKNIIGNKTHPTEKPVELMKILVKNSSNEGDLVLDCFMGTGSTGVACINTNRKFIGIELDATYFNIAKKRIEDKVKEQ